MGHFPEPPSRVESVLTIDTFQKVNLLRRECMLVEVTWSRNRRSSEVAELDPHGPHNRPMLPCLDLIAEQRFVTEGEVVALQVVEELLQLQVGDEFGFGGKPDGCRQDEVYGVENVVYSSHAKFGGAVY